MSVRDVTLVSRLLSVIQDKIVPLTRAGVKRGDKVFGSAILLKTDLSLVVAGTNAETENPLWHGEVHTLKKFYEMPPDMRPATGDCIFLATHEPCSLCLSAITWAGFDNFYYLFGYDDTKDTFNIPHDLKILKEVFGVENGDYERSNAFWTSHDIRSMIAGIPPSDRTELTGQVRALQQIYGELSDTYQASKGDADIPLS
ncbi:MAG: nucleoside deaminase [Fimbriimonadaceae bacterium]|nr:nucleoside deaminase [Alphaproteobacteria bacterium]